MRLLMGWERKVTYNYNYVSISMWVWSYNYPKCWCIEKNCKIWNPRWDEDGDVNNMNISM